MKAETDKGLEGAGLPARPEFFSPSFEDIQTVQSFIRDKGLVCSKEYETFMNVMNQSIFVKLPFQMLGLPMDNETYEGLCGPIAKQYPPGTERSVGEAIVGDALARQEQDASAVASPSAKKLEETPAERTVTTPASPATSAIPASPATKPETPATPASLAKKPEETPAERTIATPASAVAPPSAKKPEETPAERTIATPANKPETPSVRRALNFNQAGGRTRRVPRSANRKTRRTKKA
jgi:hypothetical protein